MKVAMMIAVALAAFAPAADLKLGEPVPDVALGKDRLAALTKEGKVVAVYFWSCDCPYGPPNYPNIKAATDKFADNAKVKIYVVSSSGEPADKGESWAKDSALKGTFVFDEGKAIAKHFAPRKVNATFVIDAKGNLAYRGGIATDKTNLLIDAINAVLEGKTLPASDQKFEGCGIKS
ncbi:MAG TPA: redoxin domain-containing protein [Planctomycetota bacterium]|jgi:peroxiredoxin|nr:redoxin domain-containing protein [Planctomycetota bacterium]